MVHQPGQEFNCGRVVDSPHLVRLRGGEQRRLRSVGGSRRNQPVGHYREQLRLGQIEVWPSLGRMGAGSAALTDLCLFANACGKAVTGAFDPGAGAAGWLGAWYRRHGFVPARGDGWKMGTEMIRPPQARGSDRPQP